MEYKEIYKLIDMLKEAKIPYEFEIDNRGGRYVKYPKNNDFVCSIIEHDSSLGHKVDTLEILGLLTRKEEKENDGDVVGWLTAKNVFKRIKRHYRIHRILDNRLLQNLQKRFKTSNKIVVKHPFTKSVSSIDIEPEYQQVIDENFWKLF